MRPAVPVWETVAVAVTARAAALERHAALTGGARTFALSGHEEDGSFSRSHRHAYWLPRDADGDGWLDRIEVWCPSGLDGTEREAVLGMPHVGGVRVEAEGEAEPERGRVWVSDSPFVLPRYPRLRRDGRPKVRDGVWVDGPEEQARREWSFRRKDDPNLPEIVSVRRAASTAWWSLWRTDGLKGSSSGLTAALALEFEDEVAVPVCIGHGSHYGLGRFRPVE